MVCVFLHQTIQWWALCSRCRSAAPRLILIKALNFPSVCLALSIRSYVLSSLQKVLWDGSDKFFRCPQDDSLGKFYRYVPLGWGPGHDLGHYGETKSLAGQWTIHLPPMRAGGSVCYQVLDEPEANRYDYESYLQCLISLNPVKTPLIIRPPPNS